MIKLWFLIFFGVLGVFALIASWFWFCWKISDGKAWGALLFISILVATMVATAAILAIK